MSLYDALEMATSQVVKTVTLRVTLLPHDVTRDVLVEHFSKYGVVSSDSSPVIIKHPEQRVLPWAVLRFPDESLADEALKEENLVILKRKVIVEKNNAGVPAPPPQSQGNPRKIFVGRVHSSITEECIKISFEKYGEIVDYFIGLHPSTGQSRGFAFVEFRTEEAVDKILGNKESTFIELGGGWTVDVKRAIPKEVIC